jgi:hypothetical protein
MANPSEMTMQGQTKEVRVRPVKRVSQILAVAIMGSIAWGCTGKTPAPPRVPVPAEGNRDVTIERDAEKPLPPPSYSSEDTAPGYYDAPLVNQRPPEQRAFVDAYQRVGRPRIAVFVNRTLEGDILPVVEHGPESRVQYTRTSTSGVNVERRDVEIQEGYYGRNGERIDCFESTGPVEYRETTERYLRKGEYDEVDAREIDYGAMETILTDWLSANGNVTVVSPSMVRQKLTAEQLKELQEGQPAVMAEVAKTLGTDVLVQAQARPTRQTRQGLEVRVVAEAINVRGGDSIGRAVVDVPPPLQKQQLNYYTRYLARKLMDDMTGTWTNAGPPREAAVSAPEPAPAPQAPAPAPAPPAPAPAPAPLSPPPAPLAPPAPPEQPAPAPPLPDAAP